MTAKSLTAALDMKGTIARANAVADAADAADRDLLDSGEELLTLAKLAKQLRIRKNDLLRIVAPIETVRYVTRDVPYRYAARDVREAVQRHLEQQRTSR